MKTSSFFLFLFLSLSISSCGENSTLENLSFEKGTFEDWTVTGNAFEVSGLSKYQDDQRYYFQEGQYHCLGSLEGIGTLKSPIFSVSSVGYISFLLSGAPDISSTYVGVYLEKNNTEIFKSANEYYQDPEFTDSYLRVNVDLSSYIDQKVYILIVDNSETTSINFDDLQVVTNEEDLLSLQDETNIRLGISRDPNMITAANNYIWMNAWKINNDIRFDFHLTGETGWINDPNGFSFINGKVNLFYQHNPYSTVWGPMHWGHATSSDMVTWDYQSVALAPDQTYDSVGAFSGSAIEFNGKYYLLYTGASEEAQVQALAESTDGINFDKYGGNPVIKSTNLPANTSSNDFRDPKMFIQNGWVYAITTARNTDNIYSKLLLFKSQNMTTWQYAGKVFSNSAQSANSLGIMMECPDLFDLDGKSVVLISPQTVSGHRNRDGNVYLVGDMNWSTGALTNYSLDAVPEIDYGFDFYAPTTMLHPDGRRIMVAWMAGWSRTPVTTLLGFAGAMTFPREITLVDNHLYQNPIEEISAYYGQQFDEFITTTSSTSYIDEVIGNTQDIEIEFTPQSGKTGISVFDDGQGNGVDVYYQNGRVYLDRYGVTQNYYAATDSNNLTSIETPLVNGKVIIRLLLDKYSVEVFTANGYGAMTATGMPNSEQHHVGVFSDTSNEISFISHPLSK